MNARASRARARSRSSRRSRTTGSSTAAVNVPCYRGRTSTSRLVPGLARARARAEAVLLLQPLRVGCDRRAARGPGPRRRLDRRLRRRGRPLARHARRLRLPRLLPARLRLRLARARARTARTRRSRAATAPSAALVEAAGGPDEFLDRYAVVVCSDHGQTHGRAGRLEEPTDCAAPATRDAARVTASNRAGMVYLLPDAAVDARSLAERLSGEPTRSTSRSSAKATDRSRSATARRCALAPRRSSDWREPRLAGARATRTRATCSSRPPRASSSPTSAGATTPAAAATARCSTATPRCRCSSSGGASPPASITGVAPLVLRHFGVEAPAYARAA